MSEEELNQLMKTDKVQKKILEMSKKYEVSYKIAFDMYRSTLKEMLENKEEWSKIQVVKD